MEFLSRLPFTSLRFPAVLFGLVVLNMVAPTARADTVTATVTATILPTEPSRDDIRIQPDRIELHKGENARLVVTNDSGQTQPIHIHVLPLQSTDCRLMVSPREVVLDSDGFQVFRLFYTPVAEGACDAVFTLQVHAGSDRNKSIQVKCE